MVYIPKPNTGSLWANDKKTAENHPDMRGEVVIDKRLLLDLISKGEDPVKIALAGWNRTTTTGRDYMSILASEPFVPVKRVEAAPVQQAIDDEDVPF